MDIFLRLVIYALLILTVVLLWYDLIQESQPNRDPEPDDSHPVSDGKP